MQIAGKWKGPGRGYIENVSAADLSKEREMLGNLISMIKSGYSPMGCVVTYSNVFGYNKYLGKDWICDPYNIALYVNEYLCDHDTDDISKYFVNPETPTSSNIYANKIGSSNGGMTLYAANLPDDFYNEGYWELPSWPQQHDGYYLWKLKEPTERDNRAEYLYLITKDGKLPYKPFTRKEYLTVKIPMIKKFIAELEKHHKDIEWEDTPRSRELNQSSLDYINEYKKLLASVEELLRTMPPEELEKGAIINNNGKGEFSGFRNPDEEYVFFLAKPNLEYFDKSLPKWVPQFFCVNVQLRMDKGVYEKNVAAIEKTIDFKKLRSMLGRTTIVGTKSTTSSSPAVAAKPSATNVVQMAAGRKTQQGF
jgi:hypothetical protein